MYNTIKKRVCYNEIFCCNKVKIILINAIKYEVIGLCNTFCFFFAINSKYFNDNFNAIIYMLQKMIYCDEYLVVIGYCFTVIIAIYCK